MINDSWDFFTEPDPSNGCKSPFLLAEVGMELIISREVGSSNTDSKETDKISYVSREKALAGGLAFWTKEGIPGIQVSSPLHQSPPLPSTHYCNETTTWTTPYLIELINRQNIGPPSPLVRIEIQSESLLTLYILVDYS